MDIHPHLVTGALDLDPADGGGLQLLHQGPADLPVLGEVVLVVALAEPAALPVRGHAEAEAAVVAFERGSGVDAGGSVGAQAAAAPSLASPEPPAVTPSIWSAQFRRRTAALWAVWFCINLSYYGAFIWIPTLLVQRGFPLVRSFEFTLIITLAQLPGYAIAAWLIEKWGRRLTLSVFLAGSAVLPRDNRPASAVGDE